MSGSDDGPGRREVAHRLFAAEYDDADLEYADSDEERAPKYVITPTGARVNRLFVVGVLTEVERVNEDVVRARVADPTGAFVVYAGQYQPDALAFLERMAPPAFVAITGKANAFRPEDSDRVFTSIRPESVAEVDSETRDRWTVQAASHTLDRIAAFARSFELEGETLEGALRETGLGPERASGIALAREHYATTPAYLDALRESAIDAARQVAGETDAVVAPGIAPGEDDGRETSIARLRASGEAAPTAAGGGEPATDEAEPTTSASGPTETEIETEAEATAPEPDAVEPDAGTTSSSGAEREPGEPEPSGSGAERDVDAESTAEREAEPTAGGTTDDLGDFEPAGSASSEPSGTGMGTETEREVEPESGVAETESGDGVEETADADAGDEEAFYELDEDERAEVEEEFGVDFSTGDEVGEPGEAGIDVPDADELVDLEAEAEAESGIEHDASTDAVDESDDPSAEPADSPTDTLDEPAATESGADESADGSETTEPEAEESEVNVEDSAMETMRDLAGGDGADRAEVVSRVAEEHGVDPDDVDDAIESALMSGRCYEPQDGVLKPI